MNESLILQGAMLKVNGASDEEVVAALTDKLPTDKPCAVNWVTVLALIAELVALAKKFLNNETSETDPATA